MAAAIVAVLCVAGFAAIAVLQPPALPARSPGPALCLTVGLYPEIIGAPIYVAESNGFFSENGLGVVTRKYGSGSGAAVALARGDLDLGVMSEYVYAGRVLAGENISIIATIDKSQRIWLVGRRDHGVRGVADLVGKRTGVSRGTIGDFYLGRLAGRSGVDPGSIVVIDIPPGQTAEALLNGSMDAVIAGDAQVETLRNAPPGSLTILPAQGDQLLLNVVAGRREWVEGHPEEARRFLLALARAQEEMAERPGPAQEIVARELGSSIPAVVKAWPNHQFSLSLDQSLITTMEDESRWMIRNNLTNATEVPDFRQYLYTDGLDTVRPGAVNIIR